MTKKELSRLYWLKKEIAWQKQKLKELQARAEKCTPNLTQAPGSGGENAVEKYSILIAEQRELIENQTRQAVIEYNRIYRYIAGLPDPQIRLIFSLRYLDCLSWQKIAWRMGESDESYPRRKHNLYLKAAENAELNVLG